ncbi:MAG TPA: phage holin family protein [Kineosporiaceae bacterium]|nr:phage holin family protein [Kineosporiaceae bacterium]
MAEERTLGQLVAQASDDLSSLVRAEIALAKAELRQDAVNAALGAGLFGGAGYLGVLASITLVITVAYGLVAAGLEPWLAFLIVTVGLLLIAGILGLIGRSRLRRLAPPERTIRTTKEAIAAVRPGHNGP